MDNEKQVTLGEVQAAFDVLLERVWRECDNEYGQVIFFAAEDVMMILSGDWVEPKPADHQEVATWL